MTRDDHSPSATGRTAMYSLLSTGLGDASTFEEAAPMVAAAALMSLRTAEGTLVARVDGEHLATVACAGIAESLAGQRPWLGNSFTGTVIQTRRTALYSKRQAVESGVFGSTLPGTAEVAIVAPLVRGTEVFGTMAVVASSADAFSDQDVRTFEELVDFVSRATALLD